MQRARQRDGKRYSGQQAPKGSWTFTGTKGLRVTETFDDASTAFARLYAYPADLNELQTEVAAKTTTVAPGNSIEQSVHLEIVSADAAR